MEVEEGAPSLHTSTSRLVADSPLEESSDAAEAQDSQPTAQSPEPEQVISQEPPTAANTGPETRVSVSNRPQPSNGALQTLQLGSEEEKRWKEWKSRKLSLPWLLLQIVATIGIFIAILILLLISRSNFGFVTLGGPPAFIAANPDIDKAIWTQGWQYTALPTFFMHLYRSMWDEIVAAMASRQPFVELKRPAGGTSETTLMLDYNAHNVFKRVTIAWKNRHIYLLLCTVSSILLALVVPFTAFLFTPDTFAIESEVNVLVTHEFNNLLGTKPENALVIRPALDLAAAMLLLGAPPLAWTNGTAAFPPMSIDNNPVLQGDGDSDSSSKQQNVRITVDSVAYLTEPNCQELQPGRDYGWVEVVALPGQYTWYFSGIDRGCRFGSTLVFSRENLSSRPLAVSTFPTRCDEAVGWQRLVVLAAAYTSGTDTAPETISNVSVISCAPAYWAVPGVLSVELGLSESSPTNSSATAPSSAPNPPLIQDFAPRWSDAAANMTQVVHLMFDDIITVPTCIKGGDDGGPLQAANEFTNHVFALAQRAAPQSPLEAQVLHGATSSLLETTYAMLAASRLFQALPTPSPVQPPARAAVPTARLVVVPAMAYVLLVTLVFVCGLGLAATVWYARMPSMLVEEPVGVLGVAALVVRSADLKREVEQLMAGPEFMRHGGLTAAAMGAGEQAFRQARWVCDSRGGDRTIRKMLGG